MPEPIQQDAGRAIVRSLRELCWSNHLDFDALANNWILKVQHKHQRHFVYGYNFGLNAASSSMIANDKAGLSALLTQSGIPNIEHLFFVSPEHAAYMPAAGTWVNAIIYAEKHNYNLVAKANQGSGGTYVMRVHSQRELEVAFHKLHQRHQGVCLSPFLEIEHEYRLVVLHDQILLAYEKLRPAVIGDGVSSFRSLLHQLVENKLCSAQVFETVLSSPPVDLDSIPAKDQQIQLLWKHNLGGGATFQILPQHVEKALTALAVQAMQACGLSLASVDLVQVNGKMSVLEINTGIMLEHFAASAPACYEQAKSVYEAILKDFFDISTA